jgi:2,3-bisphosphoglycerate-independent phosphoglycerate mutase
MKKFNQVLLVIFDGWGLREEKDGNAIANANKPFFDSLWENYPHSKIDASGEAVGLPEGESGNSDVGHVTIGAGKAIDTNLVRINKSIKTGELAKNESLNKIFDYVKKNNSKLHLHGFLSDGGVHSHIDHLHALIKTAKGAGIGKLIIHVFTDGRDTPPKSASKYFKQLEDLLEEVGIGFIATATGRFYADRDNNWDRIKKVEDVIFHGKGELESSLKPSELMEKLYKEGIVSNDQLVEPVVFLDSSGKSFQIEKEDAVIYFNYRADRARQISKTHSEIAKQKNILFATMTEYSSDIDSLVLFPPLKHDVTLASVVSENGLSQTHIAETEKYTHLTYFLDGGIEKPHKNEKYILVKSRADIKTHDESPELKAEEIADRAIEEIEGGVNLIIINFANPDMVGHTGNYEAAVKAVEEVDKHLKRVVEKILDKEGVALITSDHGNAEQMFDEKNEQEALSPGNMSKHTYHTLNPVPLILTDKDLILRDGELSDIAPTVFKLLGIKKPSGMTGVSLIENELSSSLNERSSF